MQFWEVSEGPRRIVCWVRVPCSFHSIYDPSKEAHRFFVVRGNGGQRPQRPRVGSHAWLKGPAAGGDPVEFAHPRHPFQAGQGGQDLPRFSTTSTFSPNEDAEQGQAVIFVSNSIFSIFGSPQWFIDQRGGVFGIRTAHWKANTCIQDGYFIQTF